MITQKDINWKTAVVDNVVWGDYPDFCDAELDYAERLDGTPLTEDELDYAAHEFGEVMNELAHESIY
jgi:hypothetical protein